jgi:hypothetical protein
MSHDGPRFPQMFRVRQSLSTQRVSDIATTVQTELQKLRLDQRVSANQTVAITVGSRGIANIAEISREIVRYFQAIGARPFIVPAMGSHGGATATGQQQVLAGYSVTPEYCGCEIRSGMETVVVCQAKEGFPVHFDQHAFAADHVVVCGRIKPHTDFTGAIESGLMKMMLIGLGNKHGAAVYHAAIQDYSFDQIVRSVGREVLQRCKILAGVGIIENGLDQTAQITAILPEEIESIEPQLLQLAKRLMPSLPFPQAGLLLIDQIGKNISGAGLDTNIVGRKHNDHEAVEGEIPKIKRIAVRSLTAATHGNATGIGIAEFCRRQVIDQMDYEATRINCVTSGHVTAGMLPIYFDTDQQMLTAALSTIGLVAPDQAKLMWIHNTLELTEVECSAVFLPEAQSREDLEIIAAPRPIVFNDQDNLIERF